MKHNVSPETVVVTRLCHGSDVIKGQLEELVAFTASDADFVIRLENLLVSARSVFVHENSVMREYRHEPPQHLAYHRYFVQTLEYVRQSPSLRRDLLKNLFEGFSDHTEYHDCHLHAHVAKVFSQGERQYA